MLVMYECFGVSGRMLALVWLQIRGTAEKWSIFRLWRWMCSYSSCCWEMAGELCINSCSLATLNMLEVLVKT
jgi:hypothetical protein